MTCGAAQGQNLEVLEPLEARQALVADLRAGQEQHRQIGQPLEVLEACVGDLRAHHGQCAQAR